MKYITQAWETGTFIDSFDSLAEAEAALAEYEATDRAEGIYTPNFYEIKEKND